MLNNQTNFETDSHDDSETKTRTRPYARQTRSSKAREGIDKIVHELTNSSLTDKEPKNEEQEKRNNFIEHAIVLPVLTCVVSFIIHLSIYGEKQPFPVYYHAYLKHSLAFVVLGYVYSSLYYIVFGTVVAFMFTLVFQTLFRLCKVSENYRPTVLITKFGQSLSSFTYYIGYNIIYILDFSAFLNDVYEVVVSYTVIFSVPFHALRGVYDYLSSSGYNGYKRLSIWLKGE
jgi:hypothetical protein